MERISRFELELQPWQGHVLTVKHHIRNGDGCYVHPSKRGLYYIKLRSGLS
jgi:hypothetical protein